MAGTRKVLGAFVVAVVMAVGLGTPTELEAQQVYELSQLTRKPSIASPMATQRAIKRAYPESLRSAGVGGKVVLKFVVLGSGRVDGSSIMVQESDNDRLAEAAREAVAKIEFVPGEVDGEPVATSVVFPISFVAE